MAASRRIVLFRDGHHEDELEHRQLGHGRQLQHRGDDDLI